MPNDLPRENAAALGLLHQWQQDDAAYDREALARLEALDANADDATRAIKPTRERRGMLYGILEQYADLWRRLSDR